MSAERSRVGFILHLEDGQRRLFVRRRDRRAVEAAFRKLEVRIVDEYGALIDESQFEKEKDPEFNRNVDPPLSHVFIDSFAPMRVVRWHHSRRVRQSSDDA